jgi:peroxiredoxin
MKHMLALFAMMFALGGAEAKAGGLKVGHPAPDFELTLIDGTKTRLDDLRGKVILLNFWATWCVPCKRELPLLDTYYRLRQAHGLQVFTIATQDSLTNYQLRPLFAKMAIPSARKIKGPYAVLRGLPTNYIIDRAGIVRYAKAGAFDLDQLNTLLVPLLAKKAPPAG